MKSARILTVLLVLCSVGASLPGYGESTFPSAPGAPAGWSAPKVIYAESWPDPLRFSINDDGTRLAALIPYSGGSETSRHIVVSQYTNGAWQEPVIIAQNGAYSDAPMQWLPQQSHPVISGDGQTIAYVGYTGATFGVYVVDRQPDQSWGAPALIPTGLANTHYQISLSQDGKTLALCDYPFLGIQQLYVLTRQAGAWGAPQLIGTGGDPNLSDDGKKLVYVSNGRVTFTEQVNGQWVESQQLTDNDPGRLFVEQPQISGDGRAIHYWLVTLTPDGNTLIRTAQTLYLMRRTGSTWGAPQPVNTTPILPASVTDGPAAADRYATRLVYTRPITTTDPGDGHVYVSGSHLEVSEWMTDTWQTTRLVEANGSGNYNKWPLLTPDGKTLVFDGGIRYIGDGAVYGALWQMTADGAPPLPSWAFSITGLFGANGGSLFSAFDNIHYLFGAGTFSDTVEFTHAFWPDPPPPPAGLTDIGGIGGIGGLGGAFTATLLGPGGLPVQPSRPVTVTVDYSNTDMQGAIPGTLSLWWLNSGNWLPLPGIDDAASEVMTSTVSHFSAFAVFGETNQVFVPVVVR